MVAPGLKTLIINYSNGVLTFDFCTPPPHPPLVRFVAPLSDNQTMKALVISGGGSKGAWAGGLVEYLSKEKGMDWDILIGTSTGSLLVPCIAIKAWDDIRRAYTTTSQHDIFSICPFVVHRDQGKFTSTFNHRSISL